MTRRFVGFFRAFDDQFRAPPPEGYAPAIEILVAQPAANNARIDFLIDTGAEQTTLYPNDAHEVLGAAFEAIDFDDDPNSVVVLSAGGEELVAVRANLSLTLYDDVDAPEQISNTLLIARPDPPDLSDPDAGRGNWDTPSLLGRDLLLRFDLHLSYRQQTVHLTLPD